MKVTEDMWRLLSIPGWLQVDFGGQTLRTLYQRGVSRYAAYAAFKSC